MLKKAKRRLRYSLAGDAPFPLRPWYGLAVCGRPAAGLLRCAALLVVAAMGSAARSDDAELAVIEGLRERRLYQLAEFACRQALASPALDAQGQAEVLIELVKTHIERAIDADHSQRTAFWETAHADMAEFLRDHPSHPRRILIEVQDALTHLAQAASLRRELEAELVPASARQLALQQCDAAARQLDALDRQLDEEIPKRRRGSDEGQLSSEQLMTLQSNVRYQRARADMNRALLYEPHDQLNRTDALAQVLNRLNQVLGSVGDQEPLWWEIQLERIAVHRLLDQFSLAHQLLDKLAAQQPTARLRLRMRSEAIQLAMAAGDLGSAQSLLERGRKEDGQSSAELDLSLVQLCVELAAQSSIEPALRAGWQQQAVQLTELMEQLYGPYWTRRANLLLVGSIRSSDPPENLGVLLRLAAESERKEQWDDAIGAYDQAAELALAGNDTDMAFRAQYRAAQLQQDRGQWDLAAQRMLNLADQFALHPDAAAVHLQGCWNLAQTVKNDPQRMEVYADRLAECIARWSQTPSADQARIWLARVDVQTQQYPIAIERLLQVRAASGHMAEAMQLLAKILPARFAQVNSADPAVRAEADELARRIRAMVVDDNDQPPPRWTHGTREALLPLAYLNLVQRAEDQRLTSMLLESALQAEEPPDDTWKPNALAWLILALLAQPDRRLDAARYVDQLAEHPAALCGLLTSIQSIEEGYPDAGRPQLAQLILQCYDVIRLAELDQADQMRWQLARAQALQQLGKREEALAVLQELALQQPQSATIQLALARTLSSFDDVEHSESALRHWRRIANGVKSHTDTWFEAKYSTALMLERLGRTDEARLLLQYVKTIPPGWDQSAWRESLEQLLRRCLQ